MHILHLIATMDPQAGGPTEFVRSLLDFAPAGITAEVLTLDDPAAAFIRDFPYPITALGPRTSTYAYNPRLEAWLRANRARFDGVIVNGLWNYPSIAAHRALKGHTPYMVFPHGMLDPYFKHRFPLKHLKKYAYWLLAEYWVLRGAWRTLFTTTEEARLARQSFGLHRWQEHVVSFGATRPPKDATTLREAYLDAFPHLRGRRAMLFLGRIHRKKGCDLLIDAFLRHAATDPDLHLVIAGPDAQDWSAELQQSIAAAGLSDRVHWPGMLSGDIKWGAFFASEVFILPSHQENFGIAVAEALACGVPVLLTDKINIAPEIAADGAGLMETDTQAGIDALLTRWHALTPAARAAMSQQALATFNARYDMQQNAASILNLFAESRP